MFAVSFISRFMHNPSNLHYGAAKRILKCMAGTSSVGIMYKHGEEFKLKGFCDSSWSDSIEDRKSTLGHYFALGSSLISWSSKKQSTTTLSSTEAEYIASTSAACQCIWL